MAELHSKRFVLRPLGAEDVSERYLGWLVDDEVNYYSQRYGSREASQEAAVAYVEGLQTDEIIWGVFYGDYGHVGNVKSGPVDWINKRADISILIGEKSLWNHGIGGEAIYTVSRYLFEDRGLHRLDAGSNNPAFIKCVTRLGWQVEGVLRDRMLLRGTYRDHTLLSQLASEFVRRPEYEQDPA